MKKVTNMEIVAYAEIHEQLLEAEKAGEWVVLDTDHGKFTLSATEALAWFEELAPGEGFVLLDRVPADLIVGLAQSFVPYNGNNH